MSRHGSKGAGSLHGIGVAIGPRPKKKTLCRDLKSMLRHSWLVWCHDIIFGVATRVGLLGVAT